MGEGFLRSSWSLEACGPGSFCFRSSRPNVSIHYSRYSLRLRWPQRGHYGRQSSRDPRSSTAVEQRLAARAHRVVRVFYKTRPNDVRCLLAARYVAQAVASDQSDVALDRTCVEINQ